MVTGETITIPAAAPVAGDPAHRTIGEPAPAPPKQNVTFATAEAAEATGIVGEEAAIGESAVASEGPTDDGAADGTSTLEAPPRSGPGASQQAWADYAERLGIAVPPGASRDEIIAAIDRASGE